MILFDAAPQQLVTSWQFLMGLLTFILLVGGAIITLLATRKNTVSSIQVQRAEAGEALIKVRDQQLDDLGKRCSKCTEELEDATTELRAQMGINISDLMAYWAIRNTELAEMATLRHELRIAKIRLGDIKE
jgi:hypothetical protein